jgi:lipoate-protein ligase A
VWIDDQILEQYTHPLALSVWIPDSPLVVLGSSNDPSVECRLDACSNDGVSVLRRYGGGGTVLLYPGCVIVSLGTWVAEHFHNDRYFRLLNSAVNECLQARFRFSCALDEAGISDLVAGDRKFAGTSLFRSRNYLLYQASIIVECDRYLISRYLAHPSKEPGYRRGRSHETFLIGLAECGVELTSANVAECLSQNLAGHIYASLGMELVAPKADQFEAIQARMERSRRELRK